MPNKKHHVILSSEERKELQVIARKQSLSVTKAQRARALLAVDCVGGAPGYDGRGSFGGKRVDSRRIDNFQLTSTPRTSQ